MAEEMVSIYDPVVDAYREVPIANAEKHIEHNSENKVRVKKAKDEKKVREELNKLNVE